MDASPTSHFLELWVGPYLLALRTPCVLGVVADWHAPAVEPPSPPAGLTLSFRGCAVPFADLRYLMEGTVRLRIPYILALDTKSGWVGIGADRVEHVPPSRVPTLTRLPPLGLAQKNLFEGALRIGNRVLVVLDSESLARRVVQADGNDFASRRLAE